MRIANGYRATTTDGPLERWSFERRELRPDDLAVRITHCGVCHTDLHTPQDAGGVFRWSLGTSSWAGWSTSGTT